jgi:hypothetical protein
VPLVKLDPRQSCYPYTWHRKFTDQGLEVTFTGQPKETHSIQVYQQSLGPVVPFYRFTKHEDYVEFQAQVRGEELVDYFNFRRINTAVSKPEATYQHLKIWKNRITQDHSLSFFANAAKKAVDLEFPISMFKQEIDTKDSLLVDLDFLVTNESKRGMSTLKNPSSSSTEKSESSTSSSGKNKQPSLIVRFTDGR